MIMHIDKMLEQHNKENLLTSNSIDLLGPMFAVEQENLHMHATLIVVT